MKYRKLRIAWSAFWGLAAVLLIVLWVRSYYCPEAFSQTLSTNRLYGWGVETIVWNFPGNIEYQQFNTTFVPWLSIIDVMMFNSKEKIKEYLETFYKLV